MTDKAEQIAAAMEAQRRALSSFTDEWRAGPSLPGHMIKAIKPGEALGLIERQFGDEVPVAFSSRGSELRAKISACWFFRLTPLGLAVRDILTRESQSEANDGSYGGTVLAAFDSLTDAALLQQICDNMEEVLKPLPGELPNALGAAGTRATESGDGDEA